MSNRKYYSIAILLGILIIVLLSWLVPAPIFSN